MTRLHTSTAAAPLSALSHLPRTTVLAYSNTIPSTSRKQHFSSTKPTTDPVVPNSRWLSDLKDRLGKCMTFGLQPSQLTTASSLLHTLTTSWRNLLAGSEGFLTAKDRVGLFRQRVVWGDMDCMSHVNNVTYNKWAESARIEWARNFAVYHDTQRRKEWEELWTPRGNGLILRSIRTDYKFPMTWPDRVTVFHKLRSQPTSQTDSFILDVMILSERMQRPAARCEEDIVVYDYKARAKTTLKPWMADRFSETFALQEEAKKANLERIRELREGVRRLELESWDRDGAIEDLGGKR